MCGGVKNTYLALCVGGDKAFTALLACYLEYPFAPGFKAANLLQRPVCWLVILAITHKKPLGNASVSVSYQQRVAAEQKLNIGDCLSFGQADLAVQNRFITR